MSGVIIINNEINISDSVKQYLKEISKYSLLTDDEVKECSNIIKEIKHNRIVNTQQIYKINSYSLKLDIIFSSLVNNQSYDVIINKLISFFHTKEGKKDQDYYQIFKKYKEYSSIVNHSLNKQEIKELFQIDYDIISDIDIEQEVDDYLKYRKAYDKMFTSNLKLVVSVAKKYFPLMDMMDLISEGNIGLMKAIEHYDVDLGYKFSTYATWWIRQNIKRGIDNQKSIIRMPVHYNDDLAKFRKLIEQLESLHQRTLTKQEISEMLDIPLNKIELYYLNMSEVISLNQPSGEDEGIDLINFVDSGEDIDQDINNNLMKEDVVSLIERVKKMDDFDERCIEILKMRYGFGEYNNEPKTYNEIARILGVSSDTVRTIDMKILRKIRYQMITQPKLKSLRYYLD